MWEQMNIGEAGMWSNPYMLLFWGLVLVAVVVLSVVIARTRPHRHGHHDDTRTLPHH